MVNRRRIYDSIQTHHFSSVRKGCLLYVCTLYIYIEFYFSQRSDTKLFSLMSSETFHSYVRKNRRRTVRRFGRLFILGAPTISKFIGGNQRAPLWDNGRIVSESYKSLFFLSALLFVSHCNCAYLSTVIVCTRASIPSVASDKNSCM